jgi:hypothetical protein
MKSDFICDETQDRFTPDAGKIEGSVSCGVCGDEMNCKRGCLGSRQWAEAMGGHKSLYDSFTCPNIDADWHKQVKKLREMARATPSAKLFSLFQEEVEELLRSRVATREVF